MKKLIMLLILIPTLAFSSGLDGKTYLLPWYGTEFTMCFSENTVLMSNTEVAFTLTYYFVDPFGNLEGQPFHLWEDYMVFYTPIGVATDITPKSPEPEPEDDPIDLSQVVWLHTDVSKWPITAELKSIKIKSETIEVNYDKACDWPGLVISGGVEVNANPWVFVNLDGTWYGATWEWLKTCQTVKNLYAVDGSHIKVPPLDTWHPVSGETYYFMVSGLARQNQRNVLERSNLLKVVWP